MENDYLETIKDLYGKEEYGECILLCEKSLDKDDKDYDVLSYYAFCLIKNKRYQEAVEALNKAIDIKEGFHLYKFRGDAYFELRDYESAIKDFKKSLKLESDNGACYDCLARAYYMAGKLKDAYKNIDKAIEVSEGKEYDPLAIKVLFLKMEGKVDEAFELFLKVRKKYPSRDFLSDEIRPLFNLLSDSFIKKYAKNKR